MAIIKPLFAHLIPLILIEIMLTYFNISVIIPSMDGDKFSISELFKTNRKEYEKQKDANEHIYSSLMQKSRELKKRITGMGDSRALYFTSVLNQLNFILSDTPNTYANNMDMNPDVNKKLLESSFERIQSIEMQINQITAKISEEEAEEKRLSSMKAEDQFCFRLIKFHDYADLDVTLFYSALTQINEDHWPILSKLQLQRGFDNQATFVGTKLHEYWSPKELKLKVLKPREIEEYEFILNADLSEKNNREQKKNFEQRYIRASIHALASVQKFTNSLSEKISDPDQNIMPHPEDIVDLKIISHEDVNQNMNFIKSYNEKTKKEAVQLLNNFVNNVVKELGVEEFVDAMV